MRVFPWGEPLTVTEPVPGVPVGSPKMTVRVWFITVIVPSKSALFEFGVAVSVNDPDPVPLAPAVTVNQVAFEAADQTHPL